MPLQQDNSCRGTLCLIVAEELLQSVPLSAVEPESNQLYYKYIQTCLVMHSRLYNSEMDAVCDLPFCQQPMVALDPEIDRVVAPLQGAALKSIWIISTSLP